MRTSLIPAAAAAITLAALLPAAAPPAASAAAAVAGHVTPNVRVGADDKNPFRQADIPGIAVDPTNPQHLVMLDENFVTGQCEVRTSLDGGSTWSSTNLRPPSGFVSPPCVEFDSSGYPHVSSGIAFGSNNQVYAAFTSTTGPRQVFTAPTKNKGQADSTLVAKSSDGGKTFAVATVAVAAAPGPQPYYVRPTLGVEPRPAGDRVVVVAWGVLVTKGGPADGMGERAMVTTVSNDGAATWSAPVDASAPGELTREPSPPVFGADGTIYLAWRNRDHDPGPDPEIVAKSTDGGATWVRNMAGVVTGDGQGDGGGLQQLAIDPSSGALYLVYQDLQQYGDLDIYFQKSTDGAATWSKPLRVNDDPTGNGANQNLPHISVAPNGRIDLVWLDNRNGYVAPVMPSPGGEEDVYYASSTDGGASFSANRRINDRSINSDTGISGEDGSYAWFGPAIASTNNDVYFAWSDSRGGSVNTGTNDIYFATLHLGAGVPAAVTKLAASNSPALSTTLSEQVWPEGAESISDPAIVSRLVVAGEDDPASVIAGAVLARASYGAELVTPSGALPKAIKDEIARFRPAGVYVVGDEHHVSAHVLDQINAIVGKNVTRLSGPDPASTAVAVAQAMDLRADKDKTSGKPAFTGAVVVNPSTPDAATAVALAAEARQPILFTDKNTVPAVTTDALRSLNVTSVMVVGGSGSVSDAALNALPNAKRLGGTDAQSTSAAVTGAAIARGTATNVVYVAPAGDPVQAALAGSAVARRGGLLVVRDHPTSANVDQALGNLQLQPDEIFVATVSSGPSTPWAIIVVFIVLGLIGLVLLGLAAKRRRRTVSAEASPAAAGSS
ncbi:MAG: cell wall-binding repeat-containing protein [Acidimicrobiales bacterium]